MTFKKKRGINLSYKKQGLIYFVCINYPLQNAAVRQKIDTLCYAVGGRDYMKPLFEVMTTEKSVRSIALQYYVSESVLYALRKKFYEKWDSFSE